MNPNALSTAYLALGSNLGQREQMLSQAIRLIESRLGTIKSVSDIFETKAEGHAANDYLNMVVEIETSLSPERLLTISQQVEKELGRTRKTQIDKCGNLHYSSRCIDIDILYYNHQCINTENLQIPHPRLHLREFVLLPLCEIAPDFIHPELNVCNKDLLKKIQAKSEN